MDASEQQHAPAQPPVRRRGRLRSAVIALVATVVAIGVFCSLTLFTGFPGPGPLRRYSYEDLDRLARKIDAQPTRTVNSCDGTSTTYTPTAHVDLLRDRVVTTSITDLLTPEEQQMLLRPMFVPGTPNCA